MELEVAYVVRRFHGSAVLVRLLAEPATAVFAEELDEAIVDLTLLLTDRLERTHPRLLHRLASPDNAELATFVLDGALPVHGEAALERRPMRVGCVVSRHKSYERLYFPSWDLRHWVAARSNVQELASAFLTEYLPRLDAGALLARRIEQGEELGSLILTVSPPPLAAFTGKHLHADLLPEPVARDEELEEKRAVKKRPPTPNLDRVAIDLTQRARAKELGRGLGLDALVERIERELETPGSALVLVGAPGVGKTSAIHELAHRLAAKARAARAPDRRLFFADATRLIASRTCFSDWRSETLGVVDELSATGDVWYLGALLALLDAGKSISSQENVAQLIRPHLARRRLRIIGESTPDDWARLELRDPGFARLFTPVRLDEPDEQSSRAILQVVGASRVERSRTTVSKAAVLGARELGARFGGHASVHAASLALLIRTVDDALASERPPVTLDRSAVVDTFCRESGMPPVLIRDDLALDGAEVRAAFEARIVGQPEAVRRMVELVGMLKAGLADPTRPLGSFLFVGPTGVGKTETAKALAEILYGSARRLVRFDMSELASAEAVHRFLGLGGRPGKLVSEVRRTPFCVLLLDEIEKAHPIAFDALLSVLGEARLTDEAGRTASFRNVVVVMTSNLGAETLRASVGFGQGGTASWAEHFTAEARRFFRPELWNRIDHAVPFEPLDEGAIRGIARREIDRLARREGLHHRGIRLALDAEVEAFLVARGIDARYGARPLKRALEQWLAGPAARHLSAVRRSEPGVLEARAGGDSLEFGFERSRASDASSEEAMRRTLFALSELRYFVDRCGRSEVVHDLRVEASRIARLLASPRYLRGYETLRAALANAGTDGELLAEHEAVRAHAESLEDLAHELVSARDAPTLAGLSGEHAAVVARLEQLGLRLAARGVPAPGRAILLAAVRPSASRLWRALFTAYAALAEERGWRVRAYVPVDRAVHETLRGQTGEDTEKAFLLVAELEPGHSRKRFVERLLVEVEGGERLLALRFDGPHAALFLSAEHGAHEAYEGGETQRAVIAYTNDAAVLEAAYSGVQWDALVASLPSTLRRTMHYGRGLAEDRVVGARAVLVPRLERVYERFMLAAIYDRVFFPGAQRALARGLGAL